MFADQALDTLSKIEDWACAQHDYVSFAKAWLLASREAAHAPDYDFGLDPLAMMAPLQRRMEERIKRTVSTLLGGPVTKAAWERAKLPTCHGSLGIRVAKWASLHRPRSGRLLICFRQ